MNYLLNLLVGEPESAVKVLTLGNQNYVIARDLLREHFGNNRSFDFSSHKEIIILNPILNISDVKVFRALCDTIKAQVP